MNRALVALLLPGVCVATVGCDEARRAAVSAFSPSYAAPKDNGAAKAALRLEPVATGLQEPVDIQFPPGRSDRMVVLQKSGRARVFTLGADGKAAAAADLFTVAVRTESELGLLGMAFHPGFASNGRFFVNDTPADGVMRTRISEWKVTPDALGNEAAKLVRVVLEFDQPYQNHNGGQLAFGPDGFLYVGTGDGGFRNDPKGNGQNLNTLLGKMLRLDVDKVPTGGAYGIPADNPWVGKPDVRPEIWAYGLRNPWRYSFDGQGRLWIADVGQDTYEEVNLVTRGANLGWAVREALHCFGADRCNTDGMTDPVAEYDHTVGQSITGGFLVETPTLPALRGRYLCADFVRGRFLAFTPPADGKGPVAMEEVARVSMLPSTFGRDATGALYVADFGAGVVSRLRSGG
jgi:glucose/arabinose dehydrogenase